MFKANTNIIRSGYIGNKIKEIISEKNLTISEVAKKMNTSQPLLSRSLNGKVASSDNLFNKVLQAIGLRESEIKEIFKQADKEEYKYKYGEEINECDSLDDVSLEIALKKEFGKEMSPDTVSKIRDFINFVNSQEK